MFTVMYWINKSEARVIDLLGWPQFKYQHEYKPLPMFVPLFKTAEEGWAWIRENCPELQP